MCGIFGIYDKRKTYTEAEIRKSTQTLTHRGPDDEGYLIQPPVFFGHRRLSIIDVATGHQPISNEDNSIWITFNGEIYNYAKLRQELIKSGHKFKTNSDTETLIHLYEEFGEGFIERLRGMFSFALWDSKEDKIILARDRLGQKPLFYSFENGRLIFASEMKAILSTPGFQKSINNEALMLYLSYQYVPAPYSIFNEISKLEPAHYLVIQNGEFKKYERYWKPEFSPKTDLTFKEASEQLVTLTKEAVQLRMISEVPLGAFLSGGIDSSIIVALMSELSDRPVKTFSIGFNEPGYDELNYARMIAERYKTEHHEFVVTPNAEEIFDDLVYYYNEPYADSSAIPTYYVSKLTREYVTVALNGDGGDESFGGYRRYVAAGLYDKLYSYPQFIRSIMMLFGKVLPTSKERGSRLSRTKKFFNLMKKQPQDAYKYLVAHFNDDMLKNLLQKKYFTNTLKEFTSSTLNRHYEDIDIGIEFIERTMYTDQMTYLPNDLLVKVDIAGMIHSLECRSPFLDHKVLEFAAKITLRYSDFKGKIGSVIYRNNLESLNRHIIVEKEKSEVFEPYNL